MRQTSEALEISMDVQERQKLIAEIAGINTEKTCECPASHLNCMTAKEWIKAQIGVWQFYYESRDVRNKELHPATFPISLAKRVIDLFSHKGELVLDPFVGSGTTLLAASDANRNAIGFDLLPKYADLAAKRLTSKSLFHDSKQIVICDDARNIPVYLKENSIKLIFTSPPYANLLNRQRRNKSRRGAERKNGQYLKIEQYSQNPSDLGLLSMEEYSREMGKIFGALLPYMKKHSHCVINIPDMWWENKRIALHVALIDSLKESGFELRNIIIWDRTNIVNRIGIFGWPSNYITMGVTFEYLLDFWKPPIQ